MATGPDWWDWPFILTPHAEFRMEERGLDEVQLRTLLEQSRLTAIPAADRWRATGRVQGERWTVLLEPDEATRTVLVITVFRT